MTHTKHTGEIATCDFCRAEAPVQRKYLRRANKDRKIGDGFTITRYCQECGLKEEQDTNHTDSVEAITQEAVFIHQAFQRAKPHDYHTPFEETNQEYQRVMKSIASELIARNAQQVEEAVMKVTNVVKANVPLERVPSDVQNTKTLIDEFMKLHYEPEHEEGQTCWCSPITTVEPTTKKAYINHQEQRVILRQFIEDNFVSKEEAIASLCLGSNQARRGILNAIKALTPNHQD